MISWLDNLSKRVKEKRIMKTRLAKQTLPLGLALAMLSGCATYPVAKNLRQQARSLTLAQVVADPAAHQDTMVIWGGRIIKTVNDAHGGDLYVLKLPLAHNEKPLGAANPSGRFIARSSGFLDPEIYKRGRLVTVAGNVAGLESQPVQKTNYAYPVITIRQAYVWPVERRSYYYYPAWGWGWYYPGWYWGVGWNWYYPGGDWDRDDYGGHWERYNHGGNPGGTHWQGRH
jgi:outer membrane lipoprotein